MPRILNRNGLIFVLASIAVNAVIGIVAIVSGEFSDLDAKILVTSLSVTGGSVLALANLAARTRQFVRYVPEAGAAFSVIGFGLLIFGAWEEFDTENVAKTAGTSLLFASGTAHAGLLSRSRLQPRYRQVLWSAWFFSAVLVGMITLLIWSSDSVDNDIYPRAMGVVIVLLAAVTLAVPVLHRASRVTVAGQSDEAELAEQAVRYCPNCGSQQIQSDEDLTGCSNCGAAFRVDFSA